MGEKLQVVTCRFHGPVGALVWILEQPSLMPGFAFSCADGSIHLYRHIELSVYEHVILIDDFPDIYNYQYFMQELVHNGPVIDLKFDPHFGRLASVGNEFAQVSQLLTTDDSEHFLVPGKFVCINGDVSKIGVL